MSNKKPSDVLAAPDDTDGFVLISDDFEARTRPPSRISSTVGPFSMTCLEPVISSKGEIADKYDARQTKDKEDGAKSRDLVKGQNGHIRDNPIEYTKQQIAWATGSGWRAYNDYIGGRVFYEGYTAATMQRLITSDRVKNKVHELAAAKIDALDLPSDVDRAMKMEEVEKQMRETVHKIAEGLIAKMDSKPFLRFFGGSVNNVLVRMYDQGIHISVDEYTVFKKAAQLAAKRKQSLLFLPCHKSHIDYLTLSWLCYRLGLSLPHIVAGENLNLPILGGWLQKCGAFFIRRSFGDDPLYPVVVKEYIEQLLEKGMNVECFIEGGRSRTGKLMPPKLGIIKYVVEALQSGRTDDVWICPISLQYDKVIETESYTNELLGNPKEKETLTGLLLNTRVVQLKLGRIDVRLKKPFSLRGYLDAETARRRTTTTNSTRATAIELKKEQAVLLRSLGYQVLSDINSVSVIMPAALIGTVLLTIRGRGVGKAELVKKVGWLRNAIESRGGRVVEMGDMSLEEVVERALVVLKDLVGQHRDLIEPTFYPISRFELSFYRNQVMHLFVQEAMLAAVLYTHVKAGGTAPSQRMKIGLILSELHFLSRLLQSEFVYGTAGLETNASLTMAALEKDGVILIEGDLVGLSPEERATGRENFDFYCFLLWPFIEGYWLAGVSLFALTPLLPPPHEDTGVAWYAEKEFQKSAQLLGKNLFYQGDVSYLETVNSATLSNAFQRMVELGVILTRRGKSSKSVPLMALHPEWVPRRLPSGAIDPQGRLWSFLERLGRFRREGKNRRDSQTVSTRVLAHTAKIAPYALEWTAFKGHERPASDFWAQKAAL